MDSPDIQTAIEQFMPFLLEYGLKILGAIAILIVGKIVAGVAGKMVQKAMVRSKIDQSLSGFAGSFVKGGIMAFAVIAVLSKLGVQTASFVAVIGAAGLAVGLALQGSLSNFAAGVLILVFRPFRVGDVIEASASKGKVQEIGILATTLATADNQKVILPNESVMRNKIVNVNAYGTRRIDFLISISYDDDIEKAIELLREIITAHPKVLAEPKAVVEMLEMADSSINIAVRPWVNTADYWDVYFELNRTIKNTLEEKGFSIPFPQRDVHLKQMP